jgi:hypothetical protein
MSNTAKKTPKKLGTSNRFIHELKGPTVLKPDEIKDIVDSRPIQKARQTMANKYGVSAKRIDNIWYDYYGGTTLKDYQTGLKKPLPTAPVATKDLSLRHIKTIRGEYSVKEPKTKDLDRPNSKAVAVRKIPAAGRDLELIPEEMDDRDAEIVAGEIRAGNNSQELISVMTELIDSNKQLSESAIKSLKLARAAFRARKRDAISCSETENDESNIDDDDSTATYRRGAESELESVQEEQESRDRRRPVGLPRECTEFDGEYDSEYSTAASSGPRRVQCDQRSVEQRQGTRVQPTGSTARARPIYKTERERPEYDEEQGDCCEDIGYESALPPAQYYRRQGGVQQNYPNRGDQFGPQSGQGERISRGGGDRSGEVVAQLPWLRGRPL